MQCFFHHSEMVYKGVEVFQDVLCEVFECPECKRKIYKVKKEEVDNEED